MIDLCIAIKTIIIEITCNEMKGLLGMAGKKPDPYAYAVGGGGQKSDPYAYAIGGAPKSDPYSYAMGPATSKPDPYAYAVGGGSSAANKFGNKTSTSWTNPTTHNPPAKTGPPKDLVPERLAISYKTPTIRTIPPLTQFSNTATPTPTNSTTTKCP
jgi:hypothetical protein